MQEKIQEMITILNQALALKPDFPKALSDLGYALHKQGDLQAAILSQQKALAIDPNFPEALSRLGNALDEQGNLQAAILSCQKALAINPNFIEALNNLGNILQRQESLEAAITCYQKILTINPNLAEVFNNLGSALREQGDLKNSIASYKKALAINPNYPEALTNLGNTLREQGSMDAAIALHKKALAINPNYSEALANLGGVFWEQGDLNTAMAWYRKAISLNKHSTAEHYGSLRSNLSCLLLLSGDYENGWEEYEWRFRKRKAGKPHAHPQVEQWKGHNHTSAEELILVSEQGLGDTLQFMRYVLYLKDMEVNVSFCAQTKLHSLIRASGITTKLYTHEEANTLTTGHWLPLMSLPRHLNITPDNPLISTPYIKVPEQKTLQWKQKLATEKRPIIGINWQGNPKIEKSSLSCRSLPLEAFSPILKTIDASLLSLQKGFGSEQLTDCSFLHRFVACQEEINQIWDFVETAAMIINCDLVITVDTAVAHLSGGLGKPTWLLLKKVPDWRWGITGETTFWYPSMRLFRQRERGNWPEVMERVAAALEGLESYQSQRNAPALTKNVSAISIPVAFAELLDKVTILEIKSQKFHGQKKVHVDHELGLLQQVLRQSGVELLPEHHQQLRSVNESLWRIEEEIRGHELRQDFGEAFVELARSVYLQNDKRAAIKRLINDHYGSAITEEKSYSES